MADLFGNPDPVVAMKPSELVTEWAKWKSLQLTQRERGAQIGAAKRLCKDRCRTDVITAVLGMDNLWPWVETGELWTIFDLEKQFLKALQKGRLLIADKASGPDRSDLEDLEHEYNRRHGHEDDTPNGQGMPNVRTASPQRSEPDGRPHGDGTVPRLHRPAAETGSELRPSGQTPGDRYPVV